MYKKPGGCDNCKAQRDFDKVNVVTGRKVCDECFVKLDPRNEIAAEVFTHVHDQFVYAGMDGTPIAINQSAIHNMLDLLQIDDKQTTFFKVIKMMQQQQKLIIQNRKKK